ncbi:MAG: isopentenyl-diphosphate delta-isomerase [Crocinitomicaceae bacterium]|nr:isopentenyl-diphosphate delta-isomerase [Crocinitomicaceae bacterium]
MTLPNDNIQPIIGTDMVVLVDPNDKEIGMMEKMEAHEKGLLHRAFSLFIFNSKGEWLLQQRAWGKYHSPGLWTNACCSHPRQGETSQAAAMRRLQEEMGMYCQARPVFQFLYRSEFSNTLIEHELDHVLIGYSDTAPKPNPKEVAGYRYVSLADLEYELKLYPTNFTVWFRICFQEVKEELAKLQLSA